MAWKRLNSSTRKSRWACYRRSHLTIVTRAGRRTSLLKGTELSAHMMEKLPNWVFIYYLTWISSRTAHFSLLRLIFPQFRFEEHFLNGYTFQLLFHISLVRVVFILYIWKQKFKEDNWLARGHTARIKSTSAVSAFWSSSPFSQIWLHSLSYYWPFFHSGLGSWVTLPIKKKKILEVIWNL